MRRDIPVSRLPSLPSGNQGLSDSEVGERRKRYGSNDIVEVAENPWVGLARDTLKDPMIWFLVGTGVIYAVLGSYTEAVTLLVAILPLVGMDAFLHRRTRASTQGLSRQLAQTASVYRNDALVEIGAHDLVPGDLVLVVTGESFPADGLIVEGENLQADESSLTGEAYPVAKHPLAVLPGETGDSVDGVWIEGDHWGFAGTHLLTGNARLRVVYTGGQTLYGEVVQAAMTGSRERTPLQSAIAHLVTLLVVAASTMCIILAAVRLRQGHDWIDALISAATLAVAAMPEEFPVVFTVFLGVGVYRLARRKALVRRGVSVENIGRVTCVCSDKTGTITEGRLRLEHLAPAEGISETELLGWAALAARRESGDPMDAAILTLMGSPSKDRLTETVLETYPYTEHRRRETAVVQIDGRFVAASKGSPEALLAMSTLDPIQLEQWSRHVDRLAEEGHKVLACLHWDMGASWTGGEPDRNGRFLGLLAFEDPVREGVVEAVRQCQAAGIRIIMVTGDHPATATAVAREIGLIDQRGEVVLGDDLLQDLDIGSEAKLGNVAVVARALPTQKLALVRALKARGEIVAVTGDGVNDVPALQSADIGIAMGQRGTRSARESASIVLLDDNFSTLVKAIGEGRQLFRNLQLSFQYILLMHIPLVITATYIPLAGYPILYLPIHIVWYETIIHPTALLVFQELPSQGPLAPIRRRQAARFFSISEWALIAVIGALLTVLILACYDRSLLPGQNIEHGRAMAMVVLTCASASATAVLSRLRTRSAWILLLATLATSMLLVQTPWLAARLNLSPLHLDDWMIAALGGMLAVAVPIYLHLGTVNLIGQVRRALAGRPESGAKPASKAVDTASLTRYAWLSIGAALATMALKVGAYLITDSVALLSDAAESLVNLIGAGFALLILKIADQPADEKHPFGHGRAEYFSSGFEGALILVAAGAIAWAALNRLMHPAPLAELDLGMIASAVATAINWGVAGILLRAGRRFRSITLEADGKHLMTDVWTTAAVLGGLGGIVLTGWQWLDSAIALVAAANIVGAGGHLILRSLSGLLGHPLPLEERDNIDRVLDRYRQEGVQFHDLRARIAGTQRMVTLHVLVPGMVSVKEGHDLLERLESDVRQVIPNLLIVTHIEPLEDPASFQHDFIQ